MPGKAKTPPRTNGKAAKPASQPVGKTREVKYPQIEINNQVVPREKFRLTYSIVKAILGYVTEDEYVARRMQKGVTDKIAKGEFEKLWPKMSLTGPDGKKAVCEHNAHNRSFQLPLALDYQQDFIVRKFLLNGEAFIVDEYGDVISGQHRGVGYIWAVQQWRKEPRWRKYWPEEPIYETVLVCGVPGTQDIRASLDNVRTRQLSDTYETSDLFSDLEPIPKKECCRMLDAAIDLLWKRTGQRFREHENRQTHRASHEFLGRHPKLIEAVRHLFNQNKERAISLAKLSPGQCSALMYLMAASGSDGKRYRDSDPPSEEQVDLRYWDKAKDFWSLLASKATAMVPVLNALNAVVSGNYGTLEMADKKTAVIVQAWNQWSTGQKLSPESVAPKVIDLGLPECKLDIDKLPILGGSTPDGDPVGIDLGCRPEPEDDEETPEAVEERKEQLARKLAGTPAAASAVKDTLDRCRKERPNRTLLFKNGEGGWTAFDLDADALASVLGSKTKERPDGLRMAKAPSGTDLPTLASQLRVKAGRPVSTVEIDGKTVVDLEPPAKAAPAAPQPLQLKPILTAEAKGNGTPAKAPPAANKGPQGAGSGKGKLKLRPGNANA